MQNTLQKQVPQSFLDWKNEPSMVNHQRVMGFLRPVIDSALFSFANGDASLRLRANILATEALSSFNPSFKTNLKTHVYNQLKRLQRYKAERNRPVHIPENVRLDAGVISRFKQQYRDNYGLDPSIAHIQDSLGMSKGRIFKAQGLTKDIPETETLTEKGELRSSITRSARDVWKDYVYYDLDEPGKKILEWVTGYNKQEVIPKHEIAKRLGMSPPAISARITKIQAKLDEVDG